MEAYTGFAEVYDKFMDNIDYPMWCHYLCELLKGNGVETGTLVELGCGTGNVTMGLAKTMTKDRLSMWITKEPERRIICMILFACTWLSMDMKILQST